MRNRRAYLSLEPLENRFAPAIFGSPSGFASGFGIDPELTRVADVNGDGNLDWAVVSQDSGDKWLTVKSGNGNGTFGATIYSLDLPDTVQDIAFADMDNDGDQDLLAVGGSGGSGGLKVFLNDTAYSGYWPSFTNYTTEDNPVGVEVGDFNEDGDEDVLVHCVDSENTDHDEVQLFTGGSGVTLNSPTDISLGDGFFRSLVIGDIDGDADLDFAIVHLYEQSPFSEVNGLVYRLGNGDGTFASAATFDMENQEGGAYAIILADLDADGDDDLVAVGDLDDDTWGIDAFLWGGSSFAQVEGPNSFGWEVDYFPSGGIVAADFNNDGNIDIAVTCQDSSDSVNVLLGNGDGTFDAHDDYAVGNGAASLAIGDFDEDGLPDIVVSAVDADTVYVLLNTSDQ